MSWLTSRKLALSFAVLASVAGWVQAQQKDSGLLEEVRRRELVKAQSLETEVTSALAAADQPKADQVKSLEGLRKLLSKLELDSTLPFARRSTLRVTVRQKIRNLETAIAKASRGNNTAGEHAANGSTANQQEATIRRDLERVATLREQGNYNEAQRLAEDLANRYPNQPTVQQARRSGYRADEIRESKKIVEEKEAATASAMRDVFRSATPIADDIVYPPDWLAKSAKRLEKYKDGLVPMTDKEKEIVKSLNELTGSAVNFRDVPLEQVLQFLQKEVGQPMIVDKSALEDLKIGYDTTISAALPKRISKRTLLRRVLADLGLTYIVKNEVIEVTSLLRAQNETVVRYYPIDNFISPTGVFTLNPINSPFQVEQLVELIQTTIDPGSWQKNGGQGTIVYHAPSRTLIIRNTAEVINSMGGGYGGPRR
jgi:hypothetical protein